MLFTIISLLIALITLPIIKILKFEKRNIRIMAFLTYWWLLLFVITLRFSPTLEDQGTIYNITLYGEHYKIINWSRTILKKENYYWFSILPYNGMSDWVNKAKIISCVKE